MTNEELAVRIQRGATDLLPHLWDQVQSLIYWHARRFYKWPRGQRRCDASGATVDDLVQEAFQALLCAVKAYDPDKEYKFNTYLCYPLKNCFKAATGGRESNKREPLNYCTSLDMPIGEDGDSVLADVVPDKTACTAFEAVEDDMVNSQLRTELDGCLSTLPEAERDVIERRYYGGQTLKQIAEQIGRNVENARKAELRALRQLRLPCNRNRLMSVQDVIDSAYKTSGLQRFRDTRYSSVELAYERLEALRAARQIEPE